MTYFDALFEPDDLVELRLISIWERNGERRSALKHRYFHPASDHTSGAIAELAELCGDQRRPLHVFCGVCPRTGEGGKSADISLARCVWNDLDHIRPADAVAIVKQKKMPPPTLVVDSGYGTHLYWRLIEAVVFARDDDRTAFQGVVAGVGKLIGGDHTHDLARLLRLPGTWNCKRLPWHRCEVQTHLSALSARYPLDEFKQYGQPAQKPTKPLIACRAVASDYRPTAKWESLTERQRTAADAAIERSETAAHGTRSEVDYGTLVWLAKLGLSGDDAWERVQDVGKFLTGGERYFWRTWDRAAGAAAEQQKKSPVSGRHTSWFDEKFK